jgi:hypothetical protein
MEKENYNNTNPTPDTELLYAVLIAEGNIDQANILVGDAAFKASLKDEETLQKFLAEYPTLKGLLEVRPELKEFLVGDAGNSTENAYDASKITKGDFIDYFAGKEIPEDLEKKGIIIYTMREDKEQPLYPWPVEEISKRIEELSTKENTTGGAW